VIIGTNGGTTATFDFNWPYTNPSTGAAETFNPATIAANQVTVFVGMRELAGSLLGQGGPGGVGFSLSGIGIESEWVGAMADANTQANAVFGRGAGPVITNTSGSLSLGSTSASFNIDHGSTIGNLWFDIDTNNNSVTDSAAELAAFWHFDHTTAVTAGKNDLYTVALHELLHALGIGLADSWDALVSGTNWLGTEAIAANGGSGTGLLSAGMDHIASGTMSPRLSDSVLQEVVMDPDVTVGTRKLLTVLDAAFLRDIGWDTVAIPEPSAFLFVGFVASGFLCRLGWHNWAQKKPRAME
jgi:hypothetical protein